MVETILKSSNLLATLINDVLDLSKLEDGSFELEATVLNLHTLFREVVNLVKPIAAVKKLSVVVSLSPDLPSFAIGDEKRLVQTKLNVVGNAVKFTKKSSISFITATIAMPDSFRDSRDPEFYPVLIDGHFYLRVQVKDTGCGISPQELPHLFTKFAHSQNGSNKGCTGSGLGLAICKRFVNLMKGRMWLESEGFGKGCTTIFIVKLGVSEDPILRFQHKLLPPIRAGQGEADPFGLKSAPKDEKNAIPSKIRHQRSFKIEPNTAFRSRWIRACTLEAKVKLKCK
ncbi:hypothetical protein KFK09_001411 [Dendrobium nobile]|uniref:histidine kinase n=1 Tax=Dendrobium nobile TaxID=94219 RepID=A0A8T3C7D4_DENNO|nr:hypothetical protein KFK09_001411 [Dendrobium nobile]